MAKVEKRREVGEKKLGGDEASTKERAVLVPSLRAPASTQRATAAESGKVEGSRHGPSEMQTMLLPCLRGCVAVLRDGLCSRSGFRTKGKGMRARR